MPDLGLGDQLEDALGHPQPRAEHRHDPDDVAGAPARPRGPCGVVTWPSRVAGRPWPRGRSGSPGSGPAGGIRGAWCATSRSARKLVVDHRMRRTVHRLHAILPFDHLATRSALDRSDLRLAESTHGTPEGRPGVTLLTIFSGAIRPGTSGGLRASQSAGELFQVVPPLVGGGQVAFLGFQPAAGPAISSRSLR